MLNSAYFSSNFLIIFWPISWVSLWVNAPVTYDIPTPIVSPKGKSKASNMESRANIAVVSIMLQQNSQQFFQIETLLNSYFYD